MLAPLAALLALAAPQAAGEAVPPPDRVQLRGGREVEGVLLLETAETLVLSRGTRTREVALEDVAGITGPRIAYREYPARLRKAFRSPPSAAESLELASWCAAQGLVRDVEMHLWRALLAEPGNRRAHEALGHAERRGAWRIPVAGRGQLRWEEALEVRRGSSAPWTLTTAHFDVLASGRLDEVLTACAELELLYASWYDTFQLAVGFYEVREPMAVRLYPDRESFPQLSGVTDAYFAPASRTLFSYFRDGRASRLLHEATHAVLFASARERSRQEPAIPGWVDEGLACYMAASFRGGPGAQMYEAGLLSTELFAAHAGHRKPDGLSRVLNYQSGDFSASSDQHLKYGQSYTLVHFLMHADGNRHRSGFLRFLTSVYDRKGSSSHFKKALELRNLKQLERDWVEYVRMLASR